MEARIKDMLQSAPPCRVTFDAPLAPLTTFGLGGRAVALAEPETEAELAALAGLLHREGWPWFVLGGGSNVLIRDGGFPGVVIRLGSGFADLAVARRSAGEAVIEAGAAASTPKLLALTRKEGLSGLEFLAGIPGWIGGALVMNAGASGGQISDVVESVRIMTAEGDAECIPRKDLRASYRSMNLPENAIIMGAAFLTQVSSPAEVDRKIKALQAWRSERQPKGYRSAGCVFKNPPGESAGRLIDKAGMKGAMVGGAWVAGEHANFIVHRGGATAGEVIQLMESVRMAVREKFRVDLEPEIRIIGSE